jgi:hypothetical protein
MILQISSLNTVAVSALIEQWLSLGQREGVWVSEQLNSN